VPSGSRATRPPPFLVGRHTVVTARAAVKSRVRIGFAEPAFDELLALSRAGSVAVACAYGYPEPAITPTGERPHSAAEPLPRHARPERRVRAGLQPSARTRRASLPGSLPGDPDRVGRASPRCRLLRRQEPGPGPLRNTGRVALEQPSGSRGAAPARLPRPRRAPLLLRTHTGARPRALSRAHERGSRRWRLPLRGRDRWQRRLRPSPAGRRRRII